VYERKTNGIPWNSMVDICNEDSGIEVEISVVFRAEKEKRAGRCQCLDEHRAAGNPRSIVLSFSFKLFCKAVMSLTDCDTFAASWEKIAFILIISCCRDPNFLEYSAISISFS
jgi:hypothetical protein